LINAGSVFGADDALSATRFVTANELLGDAPPATAATHAAITTAAAIGAVANSFLARMLHSSYLRFIANTVAFAGPARHPGKREIATPASR
jgi:hypothetical protein